jgi:hypothetical protein
LAAAAESMIKMLVSASLCGCLVAEKIFFKKEHKPGSGLEFWWFFFLIEKTNYWAIIKIQREY